MNFPTNYSLEIKTDFTQIIKVIGVGGAGSNAVVHMAGLGIHDVDLVVCNTDEQVLNTCKIKNKIQLGIKRTKGLGAGTQPDVGKEAAIESESQLKELFHAPTEMVFITAGMGGGTGTGAAPVIAQLAKEAGLLTIAIVTDPFDFEGEEKIAQARKGIEELKKYCDTILVIKNSRLESMFGDMRITQAYAKADDVLANAVKSIAELITRPGIINLDFADVKMVLGNAGHAVMGSFEAAGPDRAKIAIAEALSSPLLECNDIYGAQRVMVTIAYSDEKDEYIPTMRDQAAITKHIEDEIRKDKNGRAKVFKLGYAIDPNLGDKMRVTVVAAGFETVLNGQALRYEHLTTTTHAAGSPAYYKTLTPNADVFVDSLVENIDYTTALSPSSYQMKDTKKQEADQIQRMIDLFVKLNYSLHDLSRPTYVRNAVNMIDLKTIKSSNKAEVYSLQNLYNTLVAEKVL